MIPHPVIVPVPQTVLPRSPEAVCEQRRFSRLALSLCAMRCGAPSDGWSKGLGDVPLPHQGFYWSVSHKARWAAAVIAQRPVGIDVEAIVPRRSSLSDAVGGDDEWDLLGGRTWEHFYRLWTAKEATLKAHGSGIGDLLPCRLIAVVGPQCLRLEYQGHRHEIHQLLHDGHVFSVTSFGDTVEWDIQYP